MKKEHLSLNRESWNKRTELHLDSAFYQHQAFLDGKTSLQEIELDLLADVKGKRVLHLQCHFGQDSLSLARMGAHVTGVDLSPKAIEVAQQTAEDLKLDARFICSDVLAPDLLKGEQFDLIFATYGTICWLPDISVWAKLIARLLAPGAQLMLIEFHPILDMFDDDMKDFTYPYFNREPVTGATQGSYAKSGEEPIPYVVWNHPISDVVQALIDQKLNITHLKEYDYSPYPCFAGMEEHESGRHIISRFSNGMPLVYSLMAQR